MAAAGRICSTLKEDFVRFLPHLLPHVLGKLKQAPQEYTQDAVPDDDADVSLAVVPGDNGEATVLVMSTSELEDLGHAVECVRTFAETLGQLFAPFVAQTAHALLPVFEFSMSEDIRNVAFETWGQLCHSAREGGQAQVLAELVAEFMKRILPKLQEGFGDSALEVMRTRADGITHCLKEAGPNILNDSQVSNLCQLTQKLVLDSFSRRSKKQLAGKKSSNGVLDEDTDDDADDDDEDDDEQLLRQAAFNCTTAVMTHHPDSFVREGLFAHILLVQQLLSPDRPTGDRRLGLYGISSLSECLSDRLVSHWPAFLERLLSDVAGKNVDLQAPACYALSFVARQSAFAPHATATAQKLAEIVVCARTKAKKKSEKPAQMAADNALSALMEILVHHAPILGNAQLQLWEAWVTGLPCQEDEAEGVRNHQILLAMVEQQMPEVIGANGANIPRVLSILVDIYGTEMADDVTATRIGKMLLSVSDAQLRQHAAHFTEKQARKLTRVLRDAQKRAVA